MRLRGYTAPDDWHPITLLSMLIDRRCWHWNITKEWRLSYAYDWYDGPFWQLWVGPFVLLIKDRLP